MRRGVYFIGDLSLVLEGYYKDDVVVATDGFANTGEFVLPDGSMVAVYTFPEAKTAVDNKGNEYPVKDGFIGCVRLEDLTPELINGGINQFGKVVDFNQNFETASLGSTVQIGNLALTIS